MPDQPFDLVVIGSGPGGYVPAIRAAQLGLRTAIVEKDSVLGATCLNIGCIPSKALLYSTELYSTVATHGAVHGLKVARLSADIPALMQRKTEVVARLTGGVKLLLEKRGVAIVQGTGRLAAAGRVVEVTAAN